MAYLRKNYFILILLLSVFTFTSCDDNDNNDNNQSDLTVNDIEYRSLKYYVDTTNSAKETKIEIPEASFTNNTDETQYFILPNVYSQFKKRFLFQTRDSIFSILSQKDSIYVKVPSLISDQSIYYSSRDYLLSNDSIFLPGDSLYLSFKLVPNTKISLKETIVETQYKGYFEIIYYNKKSKIDELVKGAWVLYSYGNHTSSSIIEDINK